MSSDVGPAAAVDRGDFLKASDEAVLDEAVSGEVVVERVRLLPSDPRDTVPSAVRWARTLHTSIRTIPRAHCQVFVPCCFQYPNQPTTRGLR
jgi:hypothetical protein